MPKIFSESSTKLLSKMRTMTKCVKFILTFFSTINSRFIFQLYYTKIFLDEALRSKYNIKLDHTAKLFQNLNGAVCKYLI